MTIENREQLQEAVRAGMTYDERLIPLDTGADTQALGVHFSEDRSHQWISVARIGENANRISVVSSEQLASFARSILAALGADNPEPEIPTAELTFTVRYQGGSKRDANAAVLAESYFSREVIDGITYRLERGIWTNWEVEYTAGGVVDRPAIGE